MDSKKMFQAIFKEGEICESTSIKELKKWQKKHNLTLLEPIKEVPYYESQISGFYK